MSVSSTSILGETWFSALASATTTAGTGSLRTGSTDIEGEAASLLAIVPDPDARFPRARHGEVGLEEGWSFAEAVSAIVESDRDASSPRPIIVVVDVPSQAYGYVEELAGIHQSLAAAADALATARLAGHPVTALVVGKAISGAFLAIGLQANRIVLLDHDGIVVQVMSKQSAARITRRSIDDLDAMASIVPATAYDGASFTRLGAVHATVSVASPEAPMTSDLDAVRAALIESTHSAREGGTGLASRLDSLAAKQQRAASRLVRERVALRWND